MVIYSDLGQIITQKHVAYLIADWTNRNAVMTKLLDADSRSGVPLYLYYIPGADRSVILPQISDGGRYPLRYQLLATTEFRWISQSAIVPLRTM